MARITISIDVPEEEGWEGTAKDILHTIVCNNILPSNAKLAIIRDNDRSGANLVLPKIEGISKQHYQNKKASVEEALDFVHDLGGKC
jgi:hypothetical protein